jgi:putative Mn2+ efflux pump MntP
MYCNNIFRACLFLLLGVFMIFPSLRGQSSQVDSVSEENESIANYLDTFPKDKY